MIKIMHKTSLYTCKNCYHYNYYISDSCNSTDFYPPFYFVKKCRYCNFITWQEFDHTIGDTDLDSRFIEIIKSEKIEPESIPYIKKFNRYTALVKNAPRKNRTPDDAGLESAALPLGYRST